MASKKKYYIVTMYRWGERDKHSYVLGVYNKKAKAQDEAQKEKEYRGGNKYYPEILECDINDTMKFKEILKLEG
jgi:hypothetical protein